MKFVVSDNKAQVVRARTSCGRRLIGVQIPAKLAEEVKRKISSGPPLHAAGIDPMPISNTVSFDEERDQSSKQRRTKHKRDGAYCSLEAVSESAIPVGGIGTESDGDDSDDDVEMEDNHRGSETPDVDDLLSSLGF